MKSIRIPEDRVGALVGKEGASKKMLEERTGIRLDITKDGEVTYDDEREGVDPLNALKLMDVIKAVARGFNPDKAAKILDDDDMYLETIDIKEAVGDRQSQVQRARGRLIGKDGKTRKIIEDLADVYMSVYGNTVSLIGNSISLPVAKTACEMILRGSEHSTVYHYLESQRPKLRIAEMGFDL
ncbi:universal archaeal KH domain protein [Thermoplasmatales archaeon BRNA1]|nr:universal archaeal KH domain protein [Thermoplasmatales archaeon BRNA1]